MCACKLPHGMTQRFPTQMKKRKRAQQQYGVDFLPDIPGIPVEIIPLYVQVVQKCTDFFREDASYAIVVVSEDKYGVNPSQDVLEKPSKLASTKPKNEALESVLDRIRFQHVSSEAAFKDHVEKSMCSSSIQQRDKAVTVWLEAIHQWLRNHKKRAELDKDKCQLLPAASKHPYASEEDEELPVVILQHLLQQMQCKNVAKLRALTYLLSQILHKSASARRWWLSSSSTLIEWMDMVSTIPERMKALQQQQFLLHQHECYKLLQSLEQQCSDMYPNLRTAMLRFEQLCPNVMISHTDISDISPVLDNQMDPQWRTIRDTALQFHEKEESRLQRLVNRAYRSFDVLVPRLAAMNAHRTNEKNIPYAITNKIDFTGDNLKEECTDNIDNHDDDGDSVDWEEGIESQDANDKKFQDYSSLADHANAVDQTLAAMKSSGSLIAGELLIDFSSSEVNKSLSSPCTNTNEEQIKAKNSLCHTVRMLSERHIPRLSAWLNALTQADNLVCCPSSNALVTMPESQIKKRHHVVESLRGWKKEVTQVLRSAQLLLSSKVKPVSTVATSSDRPAQRSLMLTSENSPMPTSLLERNITCTQRPSAKKPQQRISIKYRNNY